MKKLLALLLLFGIVGCNQNSYKSCVEDVQRVMLDGWLEKFESKRTKVVQECKTVSIMHSCNMYLGIQGYVLHPDCTDKKHFYSTESKSCESKNKWGGSFKTAKATEEEKNMIKKAKKASKSAAIIKCSN